MDAPRPMVVSCFVCLSRNHSATSPDAAHGEVRVDLDDIGLLSGRKRTDRVVAQDGGSLNGGHVHRVDERNSALGNGDAHAVHEVCGTASDSISLRETRNAVLHNDVLGAERVLPVGHACSRHRVGDEHDVFAADQLVHVAHE